MFKKLLSIFKKKKTTLCFHLLSLDLICKILKYFPLSVCTGTLLPFFLEGQKKGYLSLNHYFRYNLVDMKYRIFHSIFPIEDRREYFVVNNLCEELENYHIQQIRKNFYLVDIKKLQRKDNQHLSWDTITQIVACFPHSIVLVRSKAQENYHFVSIRALLLTRKMNIYLSDAKIRDIIPPNNVLKKNFFSIFTYLRIVREEYSLSVRSAIGTISWFIVEEKILGDRKEYCERETKDFLEEYGDVLVKDLKNLVEAEKESMMYDSPSFYSYQQI